MNHSPDITIIKNSSREYWIDFKGTNVMDPDEWAGYVGIL